eukprot:GHRR01028767.1.p1 GENE.GHRR01028767.1~~GHRR01028767.1.p1  ORF type:complete len:246 (+),score=85.23 GHRR01028767.1:155-892(+)
MPAPGALIAAGGQPNDASKAAAGGASRPGQQQAGMCAATSPTMWDPAASSQSSSPHSNSTTSRGSGTVSLPPLRQSAEHMDFTMSANQFGSPMRRTRKAELMAYALGQSPCTLKQVPNAPFASSGLALHLEVQQQQLATTNIQQPMGPHLLEAWLDSVLKNNQAATSQQQPSGTNAPKGAAAVGLARQQLLGAGLTSSAADQLYRSLYVYSMGFFDALKVSWVQEVHALCHRPPAHPFVLDLLQQ